MKFELFFSFLNILIEINERRTEETQNIFGYFETDFLRIKKI